MLIRLGHSPDPDDAFMFWALACGEIDRRGYEFEHVPRDIPVLNAWALDARLELTTISLHAYPFVQDDYVMLPHGATMGTGFGPVVVSRQPLSFDRLRDVEIVVSGKLTTAFLVLQMALGDFRWRELPGNEILEEVRSGRAEAGLVTDVSQLTYAGAGLAKSLDIGEWWLLETGLPLPLTINVARRDLDPEVLQDISEILHESIQAGLDNRRRAIAYAMRFGRGESTAMADRMVGMYVNELACDWGEEGRQAIEELLQRAERIGAFNEPVRLEFVP
jgi:1,4-dihydroxy-6-naphthoate synthase